MYAMQIGFEVIDALAEANDIQWMRKLSHKAAVAYGRIQGEPVLLCKPMTFMNVSGESVAPLAKQHGLDISQVRPIHAHAVGIVSVNHRSFEVLQPRMIEIGFWCSLSS